jgi:SAM-dependent methyltransferase
MSGVARDGSPVELYARLPSFGEAELVHGAIAPGAAILELGAGAGRMTHPLVELGHPVTAVDSSAEMLAHVRGAETVHAGIEGLDLGRTFACVLLASQLVNVDDDRQRAAFLATCGRHVAPDGVVLIQRYDPAWAADPAPSEHERDGVRIRVIEARRQAERLHAIVEYELDGQTWRHGPFTSRILTDAELGARLWQAGLLSDDEWLDDRRTWLVARSLPDESALYIEVPAADPLVSPHRLRWDGAGPVIPAHVTVLYPFLDPAAISDEVHAALARIASDVAAFDLRFERVGRFTDAVWLAPEPVQPIAALTDAVAARWPDHPPYGGAFDEVIHHLTVADGAPPEVLDRLEPELAALLPISQPVHELVLAVRRRGTLTEDARYPLGPGAR